MQYTYGTACDMSLLPSDRDLFTRVHMHCIHRCYRVGTLIQKWKSDVEQHLYGTVTDVCSGNVWVCQVELCETLGGHTVQYCATVRWVQSCSVQCTTNILCVSDHNWAVRGGRQALYSVHISWVYRDFWVYSALNFLIKLENAQDCCQVGTTSFEWGAVMFVLWDIPYTSGMILSWRGNHVKSCNCNQWNMAKGHWTRTPMTPPDGVMHRYLQNTRFKNVYHPRSWWLFGHVMSKVFIVRCLIM